jgi:hypothetical protein
MVSKITTSLIAQKLGAPLVNLLSSTPNTVDLSPLVGQNKDLVARALSAYKIGTPTPDATGNIVNQTDQNITWTDVSACPAWSNVTPESSAQNAPKAFNISQPLSVFTKGQLVVGFDLTNPTDILNNKTDVLKQSLADLQNQVTTLAAQVAKLPPPTPASPPASSGTSGGSPAPK